MNAPRDNGDVQKHVPPRSDRRDCASSRPNSNERDGDLGDIPAEVFREHLHEIADWIADYRETINHRRVSPDAEPGRILRALPKNAPEAGEAITEILRDVDEIVMPGMVHCGH